MTHLYNCRHDGDQFRITKFDTDMNVEASYLLTAHECECPAAARDTCRHRQMLPKFIARGAVDTEWFYDHDRGGWVQLALPLSADFIAVATDFAETLAKPMEHPNMFKALPGAEPGGGREQASASVIEWKTYDEVPHEHDDRDRQERAMTREQALEALADIHKNAGDQAANHANADDILCDLLNDLGYADVVTAYNKIEKCYA